MVGPALRTFDPRAVKPEPKRSAPVYHTPEYRAWRDEVVLRAGGRCEAVEGGRRCTKGEPFHRMFADHVVEIRDGGSPIDPANGQCLCGAHHSAKTALARAARRTA